jgi:tetratricopeptide (TPR) repeat protein
MSFELRLRIVLVLLLASGVTAFSAGENNRNGEAVRLYRRSPREAHHLLKRRFFEGERVGVWIDTLEQETGDFSFDALRWSVPAILEGMRRQREARRAWDAQDRDRALALYGRARRELPLREGLTERAFCSYFQAEILSEQGRHRKSLVTAETALRELAGRPVLYLTALLHQSRGFSLWYLDRLPESITAFGAALEIWLQISCREGILAAWNNLAALYEELGVNGRALSCYLESLAKLRNDTAKEVRGVLLLNFAGFLHRSGDQSGARRFLELSRYYRAVDPGEFLLTEAEVTGDPTGLVDLDDNEPSYTIRRLFLEAQINSRLKRPAVAEGLLEKALKLARDRGLPLFERKATIRLARVLESQQKWPAAECLYRDQLERVEMRLNLDATFPFRRAYSPLFDGWVRSLIRQGRSQAARRIIHRQARLRRLKVLQLLDTLEAEGPPSRSATGDAGETIEALRWSSLELSKAEPPFGSPIAVPPDTALLEFWPDGDRVYIWFDRSSESRFLTVPANERLARLVSAVVRPLQRADRYLPQPPPPETVHELSRVLVHRVEQLLRVSTLLIIPHGELERVPFEMLTMQDGRLLGERFVTAYLPAADGVFSVASPVREAPVAVLSGELDGRSGERLERRFLGDLEPRPRIIRRFDEWIGPRKARWIHLGSHLKHDKRLWQLSSLGGMRVIELLQKPIETELLSMAACEGAATGSAGPPYWLGISELLLARGAQSLVVSRWQLDERSIPIFLDLYARAGHGEPISQALAGARTRFLQDAGRDLRHPFFWAGITYVGWPTRTLSGTTRASGPRPLRGLFPMAAILAGLIWGGTRFIRRQNR